ncbi:MAG: aspartate aminotransferase family protein, partial [Chloroflexota bacterium]
FFDAAAARHLHLAVTKLPAKFFVDVDGIEVNTEIVSCVRSCLMKPEHNDWLDAIYDVIDATIEDVSITAG